MGEPDEIVVFRKYETTIEANIVRSKLESYGIPCFLTEENMTNLYPGASSLMNFNVRLHLFARDRLRASQLLEESELDLSDEDGISCPKCGSKSVERDFPRNMSATFGSALKVMFFGVFFPEKKIYRCLECDTEFNA
jgi:DNA-directed RNA polymerase subunit RPC12/RpoP